MYLDGHATFTLVGVLRCAALTLENTVAWGLIHIDLLVFFNLLYAVPPANEIEATRSNPKTVTHRQFIFPIKVCLLFQCGTLKLHFLAVVVSNQVPGTNISKRINFLLIFKSVNYF